MSYAEIDGITTYYEVHGAGEPVLLLHMQDGRVVQHAPLPSIPDWAKPILAAAFDPTAP